MGYNYYGQLGHASTKTRYGEIPQKVQGLKDIVKVAAGDTYSLALDKYGRVWMFGYIHFYVSGVGTWYNPVNQIVGYILSGDPTYITSHKDARNKIRTIERDELLEKMVKNYIGLGIDE